VGAALYTRGCFDVGASSKLVVITAAGMRGGSGGAEEVMRSYRRIRRKKR